MFRNQVRRATLRRTNRLNSRRGLRLEPLEERRMLAVFTVDSIDDDPGNVAANDGTLRGAILALNASTSTGQDQIVFDLSGAGPFVVELDEALPEITHNVLIDGWTAGDDAGETLVVVDGGNLTAANGLTLDPGSDGSWIRAISVVNFLQDENEEDPTGVGILVNDITGATIAGCFVGLMPDGTAAGNTFGIGVNDGAEQVTIGRGDPQWSPGNVVSGNTGVGIIVHGVNTQYVWIAGNIIGLDPTATEPVPNAGPGVLILGGAKSVAVGSAFPQGNWDDGLYNIIAGNGGPGVGLFEAGPNSNISANLIGTNLNDDTGLGNGGAGIEVLDTDDTVIGLFWGPGSPATQRNIIAANAGGGVIVRGNSQNTAISGNYIGTNRDGDAALGNGDVGILIEGNAETGPTGTLIGMGYGDVEDINTDLGNLISGNTGGGIVVRGAGVGYASVAGNKIGTNLVGNEALGNDGPGIRVDNAAGSGGLTIGLPIWDAEQVDVAYANVISGNDGAGISLDNAGSDIFIPGNIIGLNAAGNAALANTGDGVSLVDSKATIGLPHSYAEEDNRSGNVISGNGGHGVSITGANSRFIGVSGNIIGLNAEGDTAIGNQGSGVYVGDGANLVLIGVVVMDLPETDDYINPLEGNVISGNGGDGVTITGAGTQDVYVFGNVIGLDKNGATATGLDDAPLGNVGAGVAILNGAYNNGIGTVRLPEVTFPGIEEPIDIGTDLDEAQRNVISGNLGDGVRISGAGTNHNAVAGNFIGTNAAGTAALGNALAGVLVSDLAQGNRIGTDLLGSFGSEAFNIISGNFGPGVRLSGTGGTIFGPEMSDNTLNVVNGNLIGASAELAPLGNLGDGVLIEGSSVTFVGGFEGDASFNVIAYNGGGVFDANDQPAGAGVHITGVWNPTVQSAVNSIVGRNLIGVTPAAFVNGVDLENTTPGEFQSIGVLIDGGATRNVIGQLFDGLQLLVQGTPYELQGNVIGGNTTAGVVVRNVVSDPEAVFINSVGGNWIGVGPEVEGSPALPNGGVGVLLENAQGTMVHSGNTIGENHGHGVHVTGGSQLNFVADNRIGMVPGGIAAGNAGDGIRVDGGSLNNILGASDGADGLQFGGNTIVSNAGHGVALVGTGTTKNIVGGNRIGTDSSGSLEFGNGGAGVYLTDGAHDNVIGVVDAILHPDTALTGAPNTIAFNGDVGVLLHGETTVGNSILENSSYNNAATQSQLGIDLSLNESGEEANQSQPSPEIESLKLVVDQANDPVGSIRVEYSVADDLSGDIALPIRVEFFLADAQGQGKHFLASDYYGIGEQSGFKLGDTVTRLLPLAELPSGVVLEIGEETVATATDLDGDTSQFSLAFEVVNTHAQLHSTDPIILQDAADLAGINAVIAALPVSVRSLASSFPITGGYSVKLTLDAEHLIHENLIAVSGHAEIVSRGSVIDHLADATEPAAFTTAVTGNGLFSMSHTSYREVNPIALSGSAVISATASSIVHHDQSNGASNPLTIDSDASANFDLSTIAEENRIDVNGGALRLTSSTLDHLEFENDPADNPAWQPSNLDGIIVRGGGLADFSGSHWIENNDIVVFGGNLSVNSQSLFEHRTSSPSGRFLSASHDWVNNYSNSAEFKDSTLRSDLWINWNIGGKRDIVTDWIYENVDLTQFAVWHNAGSGNLDIQVAEGNLGITIGGDAALSIHDSPGVFLEYAWDNGVVVDELLPRVIDSETGPYTFPDAIPNEQDGADTGIGFSVAIEDSTMNAWQITAKPGNRVNVRSPEGNGAPVGVSVINQAPWRNVEINHVNYSEGAISDTWVIGDREPAIITMENIATIGWSIPANGGNQSIIKNAGLQDIQWATGASVHEIVDSPRVGLIIAFDNVTTHLIDDLSVDSDGDEEDDPDAHDTRVYDDIRATQDGVVTVTGAVVTGTAFVDSLGNPANSNDFGKLTLDRATIVSGALVSEKGLMDAFDSTIGGPIVVKGPVPDVEEPIVDPGTSRVTLHNSQVSQAVDEYNNPVNRATDQAIVFLYGSGTDDAWTVDGDAQVLFDDNSSFDFDDIPVSGDLVLDSDDFTDPMDWIQDMYDSQVSGNLIVAGEMHLIVDDIVETNLPHSEISGNVTVSDYGLIEFYRTDIAGAVSLTDQSRAYLRGATVVSGVSADDDAILRLANTVIGTSGSAANLNVSGEARVVIQDDPADTASQLYGNIEISGDGRLLLYDMFIGATGYGDVIVTDGGRAIIHNTEIYGDIVVSGNGQIYLDHSTIHGNITVSGTGAVYLDGALYTPEGVEETSTLLGGVTTEGLGLAFLGNVEIGGDASAAENSQLILAESFASSPSGIAISADDYARITVRDTDDLIGNLTAQGTSFVDLQRTLVQGNLEAYGQALVVALGAGPTDDLVGADVLADDEARITLIDGVVGDDVTASEDAVVRTFDVAIVGDPSGAVLETVTSTTEPGTLVVSTSDQLDEYRVLGDVVVEDGAVLELTNSIVFGHVIVVGDSEAILSNTVVLGGVIAREQASVDATDTFVGGYLAVTGDAALTFTDSALLGGHATNWTDMSSGSLSLTNTRLGAQLRLTGVNTVTLLAAVVYGDLIAEMDSSVETLFASAGDETVIVGDVRARWNQAALDLNHALIQGGVHLHGVTNASFDGCTIQGDALADFYSIMDIDASTVEGDLIADHESDLFFDAASTLLGDEYELNGGDIIHD